jgi:hypothetical protein
MSKYWTYRRLSGPQSQSGPYNENNIFFTLLGTEPRFLGRPVSSLVAMQSLFYRFFELNQMRILHEPPNSY